MAQRKVSRTTKRAAEATQNEQEPSVTGTYVLDKRTGRLIKVSARIPRLSRSEGIDSGDDLGGSGSDLTEASSDDFSGDLD